MRGAPDVIQIGEIRDTESMQAALDMAGTGHLVLATVHSNNAPETLDRIINLFPQEQHGQVFMDMAHYLRAILSQRLVRARNGKRVAAVELMLNTPHIKDLILKGDISAVKEAHKDSGEQGMQNFDDALLQLYKDGTITLEEAMSHADSRPTSKPRSTSAARQHRSVDYYQTTVAASKTGPSTQTRFIAGHPASRSSTAQPAQPPTAQAMNSSSDTWQGSSYRAASSATALSIGVGPQAKTSTLASSLG